LKVLKRLCCAVTADTHLSTTSISKQKRLSIESVFLLIQDFSLNFSGGFDMTPFCETRETDSEDLKQQTAPVIPHEHLCTCLAVGFASVLHMLKVLLTFSYVQ